MPDPYDLDAERAVLHSYLVDPEQITLAPTEPDHYYNETHRRIRNGIFAVHEDGGVPDLVGVTDHLRTTGKLRDGDMETLLGVMNQEGIYAGQCYRYTKILRRMASFRKLNDIGNSLTRAAEMQTNDPEEVVTHAESLLKGVSEDTGDHSPSAYADEALQYLDGEVLKGTGYPGFDGRFGGIGGYVVVGGRPSMGKSAWLRNLLKNITAASKTKVALFSPDQAGRDVYAALATARSGVNFEKIRTGKATEQEKEEWKAALMALREHLHKQFVVDSRTYPLPKLEMRIRAAVEWGAEVVGVDYAQLIPVPGQEAGSYGQASAVSASLKRLTTSLGITIVSLAQLSRMVEADNPPRPHMRHLKSSGQFEQDADMIVLLWRPDYYESRRQGRPEYVRSEAEVIVAKNKLGRAGVMTMTFDSERMEFS